MVTQEQKLDTKIIIITNLSQRVVPPSLKAVRASACQVSAGECNMRAGACRVRAKYVLMRARCVHGAWRCVQICADVRKSVLLSQGQYKVRENCGQFVRKFEVLCHVN